jgi:hypothetical protein
MARIRGNQPICRRDVPLKHPSRSTENHCGPMIGLVDWPAAGDLVVETAQVLTGRWHGVAR